MPPLLLLLLAAGGLALATRKPTRKRRPFKFSSTGRTFKRGIMKILPSVELANATKLFGIPTLDEYPAPYRYKDVFQMTHEVLTAASETAPKFIPHYTTLVTRLHEIDASPLPNWRRSYALIMTVILPSFASPLWFHWYRPTSRTKEDRFNAIIAWAALFLSTPRTATASNAIDVNRANSSMLPSFGFYLNEFTTLRRGDLSEREIRRVLYDVFSYQRNWPATHADYNKPLREMSEHAASRMQDLENFYPINDPNLVHIIEGNMKAVDEIVWLANARVQASIHVEFDEDAAIARLVIEVVKVVIAVVDIFLGGRIGAAITEAANALTKLATMVVDGQINATQVQAMAGAGITMMLDEAGIRLDLGDEIAAINKAAGGL